MSDGLTIPSDGGTISVTPAALSAVVVRAAESVDGVRVRRPKRGVEVEIAGETARVELELAARYGVVLPDAAQDAQGRVSDALARMCGLATSTVDVNFEELEL
jgi:uncharacterized alkaline shock family protein YloU